MSFCYKYELTKTFICFIFLHTYKNDIIKKYDKNEKNCFDSNLLPV